MTNSEMFEKQFNTIVSNCEISTLDYEKFILDKALDITHNYYYAAEANTTEEAFYDTLQTLIKQFLINVEPF